MFGFGQLASYDYFVHIERALVRELRALGNDAATWVVDVPPTASIRRRAARLAELVASTSAGQDGPIHLVGHSTGGIDVRLVASPGANLGCDDAALAWLPRLASVTSLSAPHYGTPLAAFFATVSGQRMLYALSALTFIGLTLGSPPLAATSALVVAIARIDHALGLDIRVLDRATDRLLHVLGEARSREVRAYLGAIGSDQGAVVQVMPEAIDLFQASVRDRPDVAYQCTATMARLPSPVKWMRQLREPLGCPVDDHLRRAPGDHLARGRALPLRGAAPGRRDGVGAGERVRVERPTREPTTVSCRCGPSSTGASPGPATRTTSTCSGTSRAEETRRGRRERTPRRPTWTGCGAAPGSTSVASPR